MFTFDCSSYRVAFACMPHAPMHAHTTYTHAYIHTHAATSPDFFYFDWTIEIHLTVRSHVCLRLSIPIPTHKHTEIYNWIRHFCLLRHSLNAPNAFDWHSSSKTTIRCFFGPFVRSYRYPPRRLARPQSLFPSFHTFSLPLCLHPPPGTTTDSPMHTRWHNYWLAYAYTYRPMRPKWWNLVLLSEVRIVSHTNRISCTDACIHAHTHKQRMFLTFAEVFCEAGTKE